MFSLSSDFVLPNFLTPDQLAANVENFFGKEIRKITKLTPGIQVGFAATYYEVQIVLEFTVLREWLSVMLGIPMNSKSSIFDVCCAIPLHQPNEDGTTSSVCFSSMSSERLLRITRNTLNWAQLLLINILELISKRYVEKLFPPPRIKPFSV